MMAFALLSGRPPLHHNRSGCESRLDLDGTQIQQPSGVGTAAPWRTKRLCGSDPFGLQ
jgi:hypothetical protein